MRALAALGVLLLLLMPATLTTTAEEPLTQRLRLPLDDVIEVPLSHGPAAPISTGIGPGAPLVITIPGEGTFGCTANFVWEDDDHLYLGAAGHCFLPENRVATHGPGADYNAGSVVVRVCVSACLFGGVSSWFFSGSLLTLGEVVYARQTGSGGDLGNDFGLVKIPENRHPWVRSQMTFWGGPSAESTVGLGPVVHFGHGIGTGETPATQARSGMGTGSYSGGYFLMWGAASFGDSGSAVNTATVGLNGGLHGHQAGGILTHLVVSAGGDVGGTTVPKAKVLAGQAGLSVSVNTTL